MNTISRTVTFLFQAGTGNSYLHILNGTVSLIPTNLGLVPPSPDMPQPFSANIVNGVASISGVEPTPLHDENGYVPWAYLLRVVNSIKNDSWEYLVGVPDETSDISYDLLPRYFVVSPGTIGRVVPGPRGERGEKGEPGPQGLQGIQGAQGLAGNTGETGATGPQGLQGIKGNQGDPGVRGIQGIQGLKGDTGAQGADGAQGEQGIPGEVGAQGVKGDTGAQGLQGVQGLRGITGLQGNPGIQGLQGEQGIRGFGVPTGGLPGQVLTKTGPGDTDTSWRGQRVTVSGIVDVGTPLTATFGSFRVNVKITTSGGSAVLELRPALAGSSFLADYGSTGSGEAEGATAYSRFRRATSISDATTNNISPTANYCTFSLGRGGGSPEYWIGTCLVPKAGYSYFTVERIL